MIVSIEDDDEREKIQFADHKRCISHSLALVASTDFKKCLKTMDASIREMHTSAIGKCDKL